MARARRWVAESPQSPPACHPTKRLPGTQMSRATLSCGQAGTPAAFDCAAIGSLETTRDVSGVHAPIPTRQAMIAASLLVRAIGVTIRLDFPGSKSLARLCPGVSRGRRPGPARSRAQRQHYEAVDPERDRH